MRLFGLELRKPRKGEYHRRRHTPEQLRMLDEHRMRERVRRAYPDVYDQQAIELVRNQFSAMGVRTDRLSETLSTIKELNEAGFNPLHGSENGWLTDLLRPLGEGVATALLEVQKQKQDAATPVSSARALPPAVSMPDQSVPSQTAPNQTVPNQTADTEETMRMSGYLIRELDGKTPEEAARWLLARTEPQAQQLVRTLVDTPDDRLMEFVATLTRYPGLADFTDWLGQREVWLRATVRQLRAIMANPEAATREEKVRSLGL